MTTPVTTPINAIELRQLLVEDPTTQVLDVRTGGEYQSMHIPGSYNVPLDTLGEHGRELASLDHPVVLVCQSGARASQAHDQLTAAGKPNLRVLEGGMGSWLTAGGEVIRAGEKWALDRQVRGAAGALVLVGILASLAIPEAKWFAGAIGFGLAFSAVTNTCAMGMMLAKLPYNRGPKCDIDGVLAGMASVQQPAATLPADT
jgi:rhodanese-related sulfurtransferase